MMNDEIDVWKIDASREIADCRVFKVRELASTSAHGKSGTFYAIDNPDWVNVIAMTNESEIVMIEQFRHGAGEITLEIPGGMVDSGEEPEAAARRELAEETGYSAESLVLLGRSRPNPALQSNWIWHFAATGASKTSEAAFDDHESVRTRLVSASEVRDLIAGGAITHSLVVAAFHYLSFLESGK